MRSADPHRFQKYSESFRPRPGGSRVLLVCCDCGLWAQIRVRGGYRMKDSASESSRKKNAVLAIVVGGGIAGTLDLLQACILFGWDIPLVIAGGLLGREAFGGGAGTYILGVVLHFFIACSAAAVYYAASRGLRFMTEHPLVCGLVFGAAW